MLVLTREIGQKLIIGNRDVNITVLGYDRNQVRLGIDAPRDTAIWREEIFNRMDQSTIDALSKNSATRIIESQQARIDALMMKYCPDEMTDEQKQEWGRCQVPHHSEAATS